MEMDNQTATFDTVVNTETVAQDIEMPNIIDGQNVPSTVNDVEMSDMAGDSTSATAIYSEKVIETTEDTEKQSTIKDTEKESIVISTEGESGFKYCG